jgi:uncharacterized membrane protein YgcG
MTTKPTTRFTLARIAPVALLGSTLAALVACGASPGGADSTGSTSQATTGCENSPLACTATVAAESPTEAGYISVSCDNTGNGDYSIYLTSAPATQTGLGTMPPSGPWVQWTDPGYPIGVFNGVPIDFTGIDEDNMYFAGCNTSTGAGCQIIATWVEICSDNATTCGGEGLNPQCVDAPVTFVQVSSSSSGSSSGGSSSSSSSGSSSGSSSSSSSSSGGVAPCPPGETRVGKTCVRLPPIHCTKCGDVCC